MAKPKKKYSNLNRQEISFIKKKLGITKIQNIDTAILKELKERLKLLRDARHQNMITYKLWDVILCIIIASFADNNTWEDIHNFVVDNYKWFKSFLQMTGGIPTEDSYERIIGLVDSKELNQLLLDFFQEITFKDTSKSNILSFDGRVNNGSKRALTLNSDEKTPLNCLNAYSNQLDYCIKTEQIAEKTNEIPTIEKLIQGMNLTGTISTWDALNSQTKNVSAVIEAHGDYTIPIKGNQGTFYQDLIDYFDVEKCDEIRAGNSQSEYFTYTEKSHASITKYECFQTSDIEWYDKLSDWKGVQTFGLVRKTITKKAFVKNARKNTKDKEKKIEKEITTVENRYYISSRFVNVKEFNEVTRKHWNVEDKLHWHLDFTFCQDKNSTTNKNALLNLEIIHKFVLGCLNRIKARYKKSLRSIRKHISNNLDEFFPELLCYLLLN